MSDIYQEIDRLEQRLGLVDGPTPAQAAVISKRIAALGEQASLDLDAEDFERVGWLAWTELGGDIESAFGLVADEIAEDTDGWETEFQGQIDAKQEQLGRTLVPSEIDRLRNHHDDISDPDLEAAWTDIYGKRHTDEQVEAVEAKHQKAIEGLREQGYSDEHVASYDAETRPGLDEKKAKLRRSGLGEHDLNTPEGRVAHINGRLSPPREPEEIVRDLQPIRDGETRGAAMNRMLSANEEVEARNEEKSNEQS